jgi:hypothetical protein
LVVPLFSVIGVTRGLTVVVALIAVALLVASSLIGLLLLRSLTVGLTLLLRLIHRIQNAEVMFSVLKERFRGHPVSTARRIAAKLQVFLEKLLGGAADTDFRPIAVENVVAIERDVAPRMMADRTAGSSASSAAATARAMVAATHALHVHTVAVALSYCRPACGRVGHPICESPGSSLGQPRSIGVDGGMRRRLRNLTFATGGPPRGTPAT